MNNMTPHTPQNMQVDNRGQFPEALMQCFNNANPWEMANAMPAFNQQQQMNLNRSLLMSLANGRAFPGTPQNMVGQMMGKPDEVKAPRKKRPRRKKWKKPKDKPKRPLSAYNLFFQEERERMIRGDSSPDTRRGLGFGEMARVIAAKWNSLVPERRFWYERGAEEEKKKYFVALAEWKRSKEQKSSSEETKATPPSTTSSSPSPEPTTSLTDTLSESLTERLSASLKQDLSESLKEELSDTLKEEISDSLKGDISDSLKEELSETPEGSVSDEADLFTPISLEDAMKDTEEEDVLQESIPEMERVLATISDLKDSYDNDFVDFVSTLEFA